jgi:hypothetical protein
MNDPALNAGHDRGSATEPPPKLPHFLRVVRALARVSGMAAPMAAVVTTVAAGCGDGVHGVGGFVTMGTGGATTTTTTTGGNTGCLGFCVADGGYDGGPIGDMVMPDGGYDGGPVGIPPPPKDAGDDAHDGGKVIGVIVMPDAGDGG